MLNAAMHSGLEDCSTVMKHFKQSFLPQTYVEMKSLEVKGLQFFRFFTAISSEFPDLCKILK